MIQKPDKIYQDPKTVTEVAEMFNEMSFAEKLDLARRLAQELKQSADHSEKYKVAEEMSIDQPVVPEPVIIPALGDEEVREMVLDEWERKLDVEEEEEEEDEKPKVNPGMIRFNPPGSVYGKPIGWDKPSKKLNFGIVLWNGILDIDMDPSDYKRYETFMSTAKPIIYIVLIGMLVFGVYKFTATTSKGIDRHDSFIDQIINWGVEKYDNYAKDSVDKPKVYNRDTAPLSTPNIHRTLDLTREPLTARDSINYIP